MRLQHARGLLPTLVPENLVSSAVEEAAREEGRAKVQVQHHRIPGGHDCAQRDGKGGVRRRHARWQPVPEAAARDLAPRGGKPHERVPNNQVRRDRRHGDGGQRLAMRTVVPVRSDRNASHRKRREDVPLRARRGNFRKQTQADRGVAACAVHRGQRGKPPIDPQGRGGKCGGLIEARLPARRVPAPQRHRVRTHSPAHRGDVSP